MNAATEHEAPAASLEPVDPQVAVQLRADPPRVMRLSRKAIGLLSAGGLATVGGSLVYALQPDSKNDPPEPRGSQGVAVAEAVASAPQNYGEIPKLGPALPGDLGKPILDAQMRGDPATLQPSPSLVHLPPSRPPVADTDEAAQRTRQEREAARSSRLFFGNTDRSERQLATSAAATGKAASAPAHAPDIAGNDAVSARAEDLRIRSGERLTGVGSAAVLQAGSIIPAALITGIRSDLPGLVTAQVTQNVYDTLTGRIVLIPQGSRLIGDYGTDIAFGQSRVLLSWNRLILPDGRSMVLDRQPAADAQGFAGLQDGTDYHWGGVIKATLVSTLLGAGAELGSGADGNLARAFRRGTQDNLNRAGEQVVSRELNVRPSLTIRPGFPVRVLVTRDLYLGE